MSTRTPNVDSSIANQEIFVINTDGSDLVNLSQTSEADEFRPTWSPDGKMIGFVADRSGYAHWETYIMNADGTDATMIGGADDQYIRIDWTPDNKYVYFADGLGLSVMGVDGEMRSFLEILCDDLVPSVSTAGQQITFTGYNCLDFNNGLTVEGHRIYIGTINDRRGILDDISNFLVNSARNSLAETPSWSPDGLHILVSLKPDQIGIMDAEAEFLALGQGPVNTQTWVVCKQQGESFADPIWSPDGAKIAFVLDGMIYVIDINSGAQTALAEGASPAWSPDGKKIAFVN
jgi:Tol biopolymer transport system component